MKSDTIAAIATALSDAGIGIIRISGPEAIAVANRVVVNKKKEHTLKNWQTHTIHYGFVEENGTILDEVMVSVMKAPRSYTTEDTVEINCHGGVLADTTKPDTPPEYEEPEGTKPLVDDTPKTGDTKDGMIYIEGFGWVVDNGGGGSGTVADDMYENGNKVGIMD